MITLILPISSQNGFETLKRSLVNLETELDKNLNILCITTDKNLFLECRNYLAQVEGYGDVLTVFTDKTQPIRASLDYLKDGDYVYVGNENVVIPPNAISRLLADFVDFPSAGFISGHFTEYPLIYWVNDIYNDPYTGVFYNERELSPLQEIDTTLPFGLLMKMDLFKEYFFRNQKLGLPLRKNGYKNYVDTRVELKYLGGSNENNNVEGSASERENNLG